METLRRRFRNAWLALRGRAVVEEIRANRDERRAHVRAIALYQAGVVDYREAREIAGLEQTP